MCSHDWKEINDVRVCARCGLTFRKTDGRVMFDRELINAGRKKRRAKK